MFVYAKTFTQSAESTLEVSVRTSLVIYHSRQLWDELPIYSILADMCDSTGVCYLKPDLLSYTNKSIGLSTRINIHIHRHLLELVRSETREERTLIAFLPVSTYKAADS